MKTRRHNAIGAMKHLSVLAVLCCLLSDAWAQSGRKPQGGQQPGEKPVARIETREVVIPLLAYGAEGNYVDDLTEKDVLVLEEGESRPVTKLRREPANIVLIIDGSNEIGTFKNGPTERVEQEKKPIWVAAKEYQVLTRTTSHEFADKIISNLSPNDQLAIIQYSDRVTLLQDWTNDRGQAMDSIRSKYRVGIKSTYYDAMKLAADKLSTRERGRRVVIVLTDGMDSASKTGRSKALLALEKSRAAVFVVGWAEALKREVEIAAYWAERREEASTSGMKRIAELRRYLPQIDAATAELRQLAENSGGEIWFPPTHQQLIDSYRMISSEVGAQYSLSFLTERKPSLEDIRAIKVIAARRGVTVRSRRTYYAGEDLR